MFAVVRTGGKQYRVAPGDKIVVEKLAGEAGDTISLGDVLLAGDGSELRSTEGLTVSAEIIAQAKGEKVIPQCPFVKGWIERHPDYADLVLHGDR